MAAFSLATNGDTYEQQYWDLFAKRFFPSYEAFWLSEIVPLSSRDEDPKKIHFRTKDELAAIGKTDEDVAVAQLHYTVLLHLGRVYQLAFRDPPSVGEDEFYESFARLASASDVADELLERRSSPGTYGAWNEKAGEKARRNWRSAHDDPLQPIRAYRNRLLHGRVVPRLEALPPNAVPYTGGSAIYPMPTPTLMYPSIDAVNDYLDWRQALAAVRAGKFPAGFMEAYAIVRYAWGEVVTYVETSWATHLLPALGTSSASVPKSP